MFSTDELSFGLTSSGNILGDRSLATEYQNQANHAIHVTVQVGVQSDGDDIDVRFYEGSSAGLGGDNVQDYYRDLGGVDGDSIHAVDGIVPSGHYYMVETGSLNDATIGRWIERGFNA